MRPENDVASPTLLIYSRAHWQIKQQQHEKIIKYGTILNIPDASPLFELYSSPESKTTIMVH